MKSKYSSERSEPLGMEARTEMGRVMGSSFARNNEMTKLLHSRGSVDHVQLIRSVVSAQNVDDSVCEETISAHITF